MGCIEISNTNASLSNYQYTQFYVGQTVVCRFNLSISYIEMQDLKLEISTSLGDMIDIQNPYIYYIGENLPCNKFQSKDVSYLTSNVNDIDYNYAATYHIGDVCHYPYYPSEVLNSIRNTVSLILFMPQ